MESNWRWNVPDLGFSGGPWRLIARLDTPISGFTYALQGYEGQTVAVVGNPRILADELHMEFLILGETHLPFPYGLAVEPD